MLVTKTPLVDATILGSAALLGIAPWAFGFQGQAATWSASLSGAAMVIAVLADFAGVTVHLTEKSLILGLWIALSPLVVGFVGDGTATLIHMLLGLGIVALALVRLQIRRRRAATATRSPIEVLN
jgi:hypothetical protein